MATRFFGSWRLARVAVLLVMMILLLCVLMVANASEGSTSTQASETVLNMDYGSYLLLGVYAEEATDVEKEPVKAGLLTMVVMMVSRFGASVGGLLTTSAQTRRASLTAACKEPSFLGVFRL